MLSPENRSDAVTLAMGGALSGVVEWALLALRHFTDFPPGDPYETSLWGVRLSVGFASLVPGLIFGGFLAVRFYRRNDAPALRCTGYVIAVVVTYFIACNAALNAFLDWLPGPEVFRSAMSGVLGGFVGSSLLGLAAVPLLDARPRDVLSRPVLVGSTAGVLLVLIAYDHSDWGWSYLVLYAPWQAAYASSLAPLFRYRRR